MTLMMMMMMMMMTVIIIDDVTYIVQCLIHYKDKCSIFLCPADWVCYIGTRTLCVEAVA